MQQNLPERKTIQFKVAAIHIKRVCVKYLRVRSFKHYGIMTPVHSRAISDTAINESEMRDGYRKWTEHYNE